jgi:hypothetical protein
LAAFNDLDDPIGDVFIPPYPAQAAHLQEFLDRDGTTTVTLTLAGADLANGRGDVLLELCELARLDDMLDVGGQVTAEGLTGLDVVGWQGARAVGFMEKIAGGYGDVVGGEAPKAKRDVLVGPAAPHTASADAEGGEVEFRKIFVLSSDVLAWESRGIDFGDCTIVSLKSSTQVMPDKFRLRKAGSVDLQLATSMGAKQ